jgi:hypothetical protein
VSLQIENCLRHRLNTALYAPCVSVDQLAQALCPIWLARPHAERPIREKLISNLLQRQVRVCASEGIAMPCCGNSQLNRRKAGVSHHARFQPRRNGAKSSSRSRRSQRAPQTRARMADQKPGPSHADDAESATGRRGCRVKTHRPDTVASDNVCRLYVFVIFEGETPLPKMTKAT